MEARDRGHDLHDGLGVQIQVPVKVLLRRYVVYFVGHSRISQDKVLARWIFLDSGSHSPCYPSAFGPKLIVWVPEPRNRSLSVVQL